MSYAGSASKHSKYKSAPGITDCSPMQRKILEQGRVNTPSDVGVFAQQAPPPEEVFHGGPPLPVPSDMDYMVEGDAKFLSFADPAANVPAESPIRNTAKKLAFDGTESPAGQFSSFARAPRHFDDNESTGSSRPSSPTSSVCSSTSSTGSARKKTRKVVHVASRYKAGGSTKTPYDKPKSVSRTAKATAGTTTRNGALDLRAMPVSSAKKYGSVPKTMVTPSHPSTKTLVTPSNSVRRGVSATRQPNAIPSTARNILSETPKTRRTEVQQEYATPGHHAQHDDALVTPQHKALVTPQQARAAALVQTTTSTVYGSARAPSAASAVYGSARGSARSVSRTKQRPQASNPVTTSARPTSAVASRTAASVSRTQTTTQRRTAEPAHAPAHTHTQQREAPFRGGVDTESVASSVPNSTSQMDGGAVPGQKAKSYTVMAQELALLQTTLLQWSYINARTRASFARQQKKAEHAIYNIWRDLQQRRLLLSDGKIRILKEKHIKSLDARLKTEFRDCSDLEESMPTFLKNYDALTESLRSTMHRIPLNNVTADSKSVLEALSASDRLLRGIDADVQPHLSQIVTFANTVKTLDIAAREECAELAQCRNLLLALTDLENEERSLLIHKMQMLRASE